MLDCSALSTKKNNKKKAYKGTILVFPLRFLVPTQCEQQVIALIAYLGQDTSMGTPYPPCLLGI